VGSHIALSDSVTLADLLGRAVGFVLSDAVTLTDALILDAGVVLLDSVTPADQLVADAAVFLSDDLVTLTDAIATHAGQIVIADMVTLSDELVAGAHISLSDAVTLSDQRAAGAGIPLSDGVTLADLLVADASIVLADSVTPADALQHGGIFSLSDSVFLTDALSVLITAQGWDAGFTIWSGRKQPKQGRQSVSSRPKPLTAVVTSSANTTYTQTSVTDTAGWLLTNVQQHHIAVTEDGYIGPVESVAGNTVTVRSWWRSSVNLLGRAAARPSDGQGVTIHQVIQGESVRITASPGNTDYVYLGTSNAVNTITGFPISNNLTSPRSRLLLEVKPGDNLYINVSRLWVTALSAQNIDWVVTRTRR
jgi:hypothetical protein